MSSSPFVSADLLYQRQLEEEQKMREMLSRYRCKHRDGLHCNLKGFVDVFTSANTIRNVCHYCQQREE